MTYSIFGSYYLIFFERIITMGCSYSQSHLTKGVQHSEWLDKSVAFPETPPPHFSTNLELFDSKDSSPRVNILQNGSKKMFNVKFDAQEIEYSDCALNGRTFLQSPLGKMMQFNIHCMTPKRSNRNKDTSDFCPSADSKLDTVQKRIVFE